MSRRHIVVFSGGSAANSLVDVFGKVAEDGNCSLSYVIPISDNGGSSSELIRVFGGPGIGDVRSRLVRLIPEDPTSGEKAAIKKFFNHRLSACSSTARTEWLSIVEARHPLWASISPAKRELIRSFLSTLHLEILKRLRPSSTFNFQSAAVGNLFLTGARLFTGSFESAIYLLGAITAIPKNIDVLPAINSNFSHHISAGLEDGTIITGQNSISHPSPTPDPTRPPTPTTQRRLSLTHDPEDASLPGSLPSLRLPAIEFEKAHTLDLPTRISRIWYINPYGQEIQPSPNPAVLDSLGRASCIIYSIGSLYTSLLPCLVLKGVGPKIIAPGGARWKILLLNGSLDRETRSLSDGPFSALDFLEAIAHACGARIHECVTHVIYLHGHGTPRVDKDKLTALGVEGVRIYGRRATGGEGMVYDSGALTGALEAIMGSPKRKGTGEKSRRNTVDDFGR